MKPANRVAPHALCLANEPNRLASLRSFPVPGSTPEPAFTDAALLAAFICETPVALLALMDGEHLRFKAQVGLDVAKSSGALAFGRAALQSTDEVYEISDATLHPLFAANPLVTSCGVCYFAGVPLRTPEGQQLGTLAALDTEPRRLSTDQRMALGMLGRQVLEQLELRRTRLQLEDERQKFGGVLRMATLAEEMPFLGSRTEIFVKQDQRLVRVAAADLHYVEALGDYVNLYTTHERLTVYGTMKDLETKLSGREFARIHRKYIVRLDRIVALECDAALLDSGRAGGAASAPVRVPIGSSYRAGLLGRLTVL